MKAARKEHKGRAQELLASAIVQKAVELEVCVCVCHSAY